MNDISTTVLIYGIFSWAFFLKIIPYILAVVIGIFLCKYLAKQIAKEIRKHNGELARQIVYELNKNNKPKNTEKEQPKNQIES